ncbi:MAG TPA: hypothetical protein VMI13_02110 [Solirubrobacteraceae bacterium]|nr:hypothetical protein [Solirubrobacteraceae bacterium]
MSAPGSGPPAGEDGGGDPAALRVVAAAASEPEAELISQRLQEVGIAALVQRTIGGPEWGSSGARYVYVRADELQRAREVLGTRDAPP